MRTYLEETSPQLSPGILGPYGRDRHTVHTNSVVVHARYPAVTLQTGVKVMIQQGLQARAHD